MMSAKPLIELMSPLMIAIGRNSANGNEQMIAMTLIANFIFVSFLFFRQVKYTIYFAIRSHNIGDSAMRAQFHRYAVFEWHQDFESPPRRSTCVGVASSEKKLDLALLVFLPVARAGVRSFVV